MSALGLGLSLGNLGGARLGITQLLLQYTLKHHKKLNFWLVPLVGRQPKAFIK